ncbi:SMP-30/gluconolactonase/LRE family protein [Paenibacillus sp. FSL K6-0276]|uniref:stalk domain-containing protein n=1 Tax=Paenibacillus sp. FSL K6-0276 TaxID=2921450 RepID=UPI0030EEDC86
MKKKLISIVCGFMFISGSLSSIVTAEAVQNTSGDVQGTITQNASSNAVLSLKQPWGLTTVPGSNDLIIVQSGSGTISKWSNGELQTVAGQGAEGYIDDKSAKALFNHPTYTAADSKGNIYISDTDNHVIRKIKNGEVYTLAGTGVAGYKDGQRNEAQFNSPGGLAVDSNNNVYVADTLNHVIRKVTSEGIVTTFAGQQGSNGAYLDGAVASAKFNEPVGLVFDETGNLYVADSGNQMIRLIKGSKVETFAGKATSIDPVTGYMAGGFQNGDRLSALFNRPRGLAYADGVLLIADSLNHRVRAIQKDEKVITVAGQGTSGDQVGALDKVMFNQPSGVALMSGKLYVSDTLNNKLKVLNLDLQALKPLRSEADLLDAVSLLPAGKNIQVWLDGVQVKLNTTTLPLEQSDRIYLPVRALFGSWGADIRWDTASKETVISKGEWTLSLKPDVSLNVQIIKGTLYVAADYLPTVSSFMQVYDEDSHAIVLESGQ